MKMEFIGFFEKSIYKNTYIYNLVDYFLRHIYPYSTLSKGGNDIILLFDHYLRFNPESYVIYINANMYFSS